MTLIEGLAEEYHYLMVRAWCEVHSVFSKRLVKTRAKSDLHRMIFANEKIWKHVRKCKKHFPVTKLET